MYKIEEMRELVKTINPLVPRFVSKKDEERKKRCEETLRRMGAI